MHPNSSDEKVVVDVLANPNDANYPDLIIYVADATNLERHLLLATQIIDLGIPMIFCLNMIDIIEERKQNIDPKVLSDYLSVPVVPISGRNSTNIEALKYQIIEFKNSPSKSDFLNSKSLYTLPTYLNEALKEVKSNLGVENDYLAKIAMHHHPWLLHFNKEEKETLQEIATKYKFEDLKHQIDETMDRYAKFSPIARKTIFSSKVRPESRTDKIDNVITHRFWGPLIFFGLMLLVFQAIYAWAEAPMEWIDATFANLGSLVRSGMPEAWYTNLIVDGVIAGLGGIIIFIPQITILFLLISILEETGYMSRAVFMFDGIMQKFGLNGRSIVALVSSGACAIPAIMSTRTISSWKERLNTIMVSPLISCSARIPVYTILIGFVVPKGHWGVFNYQGLAFMGLYLLGIVAALVSAYAFKKILKVEDNNSYLMIELPQYKPPIWKNALLNVKEKVQTFVLEAGKVILVISIILWFLASYGPPTAMKEAKLEAQNYIEQNDLQDVEAENYLAGKQIEASFAGHLGKFIEPAIKPLGFDWKMGIAIITSFAAREVFVGTMATIYSIGSAEDESTIVNRMRAELNPETGKMRYNPATALSLLIFYVFAMQCMSTLAIVKRETKSWKWPAIQFVYMSAMAYLGSLIVFQIFG